MCCTVREGHKGPKRGVTNVANIQDSQEQAPCATYRFLGLIQGPHEAPVTEGPEGISRYVEWTLKAHEWTLKAHTWTLEVYTWTLKASEPVTNRSVGRRRLRRRVKC